MRTIGIAKPQSKPGKAYDPARAIARWETDGGAPQGGRLSKSAAILLNPGKSAGQKKVNEAN